MLGSSSSRRWRRAGPQPPRAEFTSATKSWASSAAGEEESVLGSTIPSVLEKLAGMAGTDVAVRFVPRGSVDAQTVSLRRAPGIKQNNQVQFKNWPARSSPQSLVIGHAGGLLVFDANDGVPISVDPAAGDWDVWISIVLADGKLLAGHQSPPPRSSRRARTRPGSV